jgi:AraC-like DNA-binding protein
VDFFKKSHCEDAFLFFKAKEMFPKAIPFKIYRLDSGNTQEHFHDYMQIWYVINGCCEHRINSAGYHMARGSLFVVPPYISHQILPIDGQSVEIVGCEFLVDFIDKNVFGEKDHNALFDFAYLEPFFIATEKLRPKFQLSGINQIKVEELLIEMLEEYEEEKKYYEISIKADLLKMLTITARAYEAQKDSKDYQLFDKYRNAIDAAIKHIHDNYTEKLYIEDVCKLAMMSVTYFSYLFKQITGKTFTEYVNDMRVCRAMEMLAGGNLLISEICFSTGFNDATYFNRVFRKKTGLSPTQYRLISQSISAVEAEKTP